MRLTTSILALALVAGCGDKDGPVGHGDGGGDTDTGPDTDTDGDDSGDTDTDEPPPDADGDGAHDGVDCAPEDPEIYPGAEEIPYDGIDQDCDGLDLTDWDDDGFDAQEVGGTDCNDEDPSVNPGALDEENGQDDDCDGDIDEDVPIIPTDWPIRLGGTGATTTAPRLANAEDGSLVVYGTIDGFVDLEPTWERTEGRENDNGTPDLFVATYGDDRVLGLATGAVTDADAEATPTGLHVDGGGGMTISATFTGTLDLDDRPPLYTRESLGESDGVIGRFNNTGELVWAASFGGTGADTATDVVAAGSGTTFVVGSVAGEAALYGPGSANTGQGTTPLLQVTATGDADGLLAAYDLSGTPQWAVLLSASTAGEWVQPVAVLPGLDTVYVVGQFSGTADLDPDEAGAETVTSAGGADVFVAAYSAADGSLLWASVLPCTGTATALNADLDADESILVVGEFDGTLDMDPGAGDTADAAVGGTDAFAVILDSTGARTWSTAQGGSGDDRFAGGAADGSGGAALAGRFEGNVSFGGTPLTSAGQGDCVALHLDGTGSATWARAFGSPADEGCWDLSLSSDGSVYFSGPISYSFDFSESGADDLRRPTGVSDAWVHRLPLAP